MTGKTLNTDTAVAADAERHTEMTEPKITREEIEALLKLADAATPGPWERRETEVPIGDTGDHDVSFSISPVGSQEQIICQYWDGLSEDEPNLSYIAAANPAVLKALCDLALKAKDIEPRPMSEFSPLGPAVVSQAAYVTNGKHYGEAVRSHDEPRWAWTQTRHWCEPQPTHFYSLTSLPEPRR